MIRSIKKVSLKYNYLKRLSLKKKSNDSKDLSLELRELKPKHHIIVNSRDINYKLSESEFAQLMDRRFRKYKNFRFLNPEKNESYNSRHKRSVIYQSETPQFMNLTMNKFKKFPFRKCKKNQFETFQFAKRRIGKLRDFQSPNYRKDQFTNRRIDKSRNFQSSNYRKDQFTNQRTDKSRNFQSSNYRKDQFTNQRTDKSKNFQSSNYKFNKFKQVNSRYENGYRTRKNQVETHYINFTKKWMDPIFIKKTYNFNKILQSNHSVILFWFIYLFNLFNFLLPNIIIKKLLDLTSVYLYHDANKHYYYFKLISLYPYKAFDRLIYDDSIENKNINSFLNQLIFSFSYNDFFLKKKIIQLYQNFSLKLSNKSLRFRFLFNLARKHYRRKLKIKKLLRRRRRRLFARFNIRSLRRFTRCYFTKKKYFKRRKFKRGKLVTRKRIKKRRKFGMKLLV